MNKKIEKITIFSFLVIGLFTSLFFIDLFPFSFNPLYTKSDTRFTFLDVKSFDGKQLSHSVFNVHIDYASLFEIQGIYSPFTMNKFGSDLNVEDVVAMITRKLEAYPSLRGVNLYIYDVGQIDQAVGIRSKKVISIKNLSFSETEAIDNSVYYLDKYFRRIKSYDLL